MNKVILVTGGSSGIGKSICTFLQKNNQYKVIGTSRKAYQSGVFPYDMVVMDVNQQESVNMAIDKIISQYGKIDVVVNNAGIGMIAAVGDGAIEEVHKVMDTNVYGVLRVCRAVLPSMRTQKSGLIINVSSIAGLMGLPYRAIYSASKSCVEMITESLRMEEKRFGIKACVIEPGDFATNISDNRSAAEASKLSPHYDVVDRLEKSINEEVAHAGDPILVSKKVAQIIKKNNPGVRYAIGKPLQKLSIFIRRIVPATIFEKIIAGHYKL